MVAGLLYCSGRQGAASLVEGATLGHKKLASIQCAIRYAIPALLGTLKSQRYLPTTESLSPRICFPNSLSNPPSPSNTPSIPLSGSFFDFTTAASLLLNPSLHCDFCQDGGRCPGKKDFLSSHPARGPRPTNHFSGCAHESLTSYILQILETFWS